MNTVTPPSPRWPHVRAAFHAYAHWLVPISWKRSWVLALLLMIGASSTDSSSVWSGRA